MSRLYEIIESKGEAIVGELGGAQRLRIIAILGATLGLDSADKAAVSSVAGPLKHALSLDNTEFGALLAVVSFTGALLTFPAGVLADRLNRRHILVAVVAMWAAAMVFSGLSRSFTWLIISRLFLGLATAAAWPSIASLTGDFFPPAERASTYGLIISGELVGTAAGFLLASEAATLMDWHWAFYVLALPSALLAVALWKFLPEPGRGGQSWLAANDRGHVARKEEQHEDAQHVAAEQDIDPDRRLLRDHRDFEKMSWSQIMTYCLRIESYRRLVLASALIYFFFSGVRAFGVLYFEHHFNLPHRLLMVCLVIVGIGGLAGVIGGGHVSRAVLDRGWLSARVIVPTVSLFVTLPLIGFGIAAGNPWLGIGLITAGSATLAAAIAPIDAARLDVVNSPIWGRSESGRAALRYFFEGLAPLVLGGISGLIGEGNSQLEWTFLIVLVSLLAAAVICIPLWRSYPRDVATAAAFAERRRRDDHAGGPTSV